MLYEKGKSGNPKGRPKGAGNLSVREIKDIIRSRVNFDELIDDLAKRAKKSDFAVKILLEYGFGKPSEMRNDSNTIDPREFAEIFGKMVRVSEQGH